MAILSQTDQLTGLEATRRTKNQDGLLMIEAMAQTNEILLDMPIVEANDGTVHNTVIRTSQPTGTKRKYNEGIGSKASTSKTVQDRITMLADYSVTDRDLADHSGNKDLLLNSEDIAFLNGMGETQADDIIYGDNASDESEINGFAVRLKALSNKNVLSAGGTGGSCTSIYVVACGAMYARLIHPKGRSDCGVKREDMGFQNWAVPELVSSVLYQKTMPAYVRYFSAQYGLSLGHPDSVKRIANIVVGTTADALIDLVLEAIWKLPKGNRNVAIYGNSDVLLKIDKAGRTSGNVVQTREDPWGKPITHVREGRCRNVDTIMWTEAQVV